MIELTEQQRQEIALQAENPIRVLDPATREEFVLIRAERFAERDNAERFAERDNAGQLSEDEQAVRFGVYPPLYRGMKSYWQELPELVRSWWKRGKWVAYYGDTRIGIASRESTLLRKCRSRRIPLDEVYIAQIIDRSQSPWEQESID
jgi:hypothetical protein